MSEPKERSLLKHEIDSFKLEYVEKLIKLCQSHHVPLVLVGSPKYGMIESSELNPVKEISEVNNVMFWDYYADQTFNMHKEWFNEPMHLNKDGARVFSKIIAERLIKEKLIN